MPARFSNASFQTFDIAAGGSTSGALADAFSQAHSWAQDYEPGNPQGKAGVVLAGPVGVGKTHLIVAVIRELPVLRS